MFNSKYCVCVHWQLTPYFLVVAPQLDMYSLGVTVWAVIYARYPLDVEPLVVSDNCSNVHDTVRTPLLQLLHADPECRWSAAQLVAYLTGNM